MSGYRPDLRIKPIVVTSKAAARRLPKRYQACALELLQTWEGHKLGAVRP